MRTRAVILREVGLPRPYASSRPLRVEEVELADPGPGEVLIEIAAAGLCHSDLSAVNGDRPRPVPMAVGHEAAGVVRSLGPGVAGLVPGDHVVTLFVPACGVCQPCRAGRPALCEAAAAANGSGTLVGGGLRLSGPGGETIRHHLGVSAFAERAVVSANSIVRVDADLPLEQAAVFGCAVLTGVGAVVNTARVRAGQSVAIVGLGGVGLAALLGAVASGAREIIAVDRHPSKLQAALDLGASATVAAGPEAGAQIRDLTSGGVEIAIETAGAVAALETAYAATRRGGTTVTASLPPPDARWPISPAALVGEERTIKGSYIGSSVPSRDIPNYIMLFQAGRLPVDRILGRTYAMDEINVALDSLDAGEALRQVVLMDSGATRTRGIEG